MQEHRKMQHPIEEEAFHDLETESDVGQDKQKHISVQRSARGPPRPPIPTSPAFVEMQMQPVPHTLSSGKMRYLGLPEQKMSRPAAVVEEAIMVKPIAAPQPQPRLSAVSPGTAQEQEVVDEEEMHSLAYLPAAEHVPYQNLFGKVLFGKGGYYGPANAANVPLERRLKIYIALRIYYIRHIDCKEGTYELSFRQLRTIRKPPGMEHVLPLLRERAKLIGARMSNVPRNSHSASTQQVPSPARATTERTSNSNAASPPSRDHHHLEGAVVEKLQIRPALASSPTAVSKVGVVLSEPNLVIGGCSPQPSPAARSHAAQMEAEEWMLPTRYYLSPGSSESFPRRFPCRRSSCFRTAWTRARSRKTNPSCTSRRATCTTLCTAA
ncbi:unnamed protein product [Amoebophrya sp. A120]|nr:unnamed protein product [Amoebophrya sp. A120]|eukprot:GSA120T00001613001.1